MTSQFSEGSPLTVACLCAAWCNNCGSYQPLFESLQGSFAGVARFAWIDIEDESEVLGDVDVENFPTLLLLKDGIPLFLGPLTPQAGVLTQLVQTALDGRLVPLTGAVERALALRVQAHLAQARVD